MKNCNTKRARVKKSMGGSILSGAASGVSMGSVAGPWGMAAGAVIGGITGLIKGKKEASEEEKLKAQEKATERLNDYLSDKMALQSYDNLFNAAYGGSLPTGVETQLGSFLEAAQAGGKSSMLNSNMAKMVGGSHEQGGIPMDANFDGSIDTELEGGEVMQEERVYSKRLKPTQEVLELLAEDGFKGVDGSYAKIAEKIGAMKKKYETKLVECVDEPSINTAQLMLERIEGALNMLFVDQEMSKSFV